MIFKPKLLEMMRKTCFVLLLFLGVSQLAQAQQAKLKKAFNGKNLKGWVVPENNIWWSVKEGVLFAKSDPEKTGSILWTKKNYNDFVIETEFLYGEGTVDTGIFLRTEKEQIQMGISGSLKRDMTGSPYIVGKGYPVEAEGVADILRPNEWNTIKIKAVDNVYTVWLNGHKVVTYTSDDVPEEGPIGLQLHPGRDMTTSFRNIRIGELD
ncbi:protein of unknown function [Pseudozobellia thermophila]|uniref:3-keto-alpha-glucoside-1,2-lyase/3-keto-2-hydroxy-glucal hydratase domain-containing protein n=2 Tax=Pseudozobellia thermophila TaxID=192903 RepID=A0A1M6MCD0_9FLAO|nr:protein of unknown function [Pseudozobellia thermophila]